MKKIYLFFKTNFLNLILISFICLIIYIIFFHFSIILSNIGTFTSGVAALLVIFPTISEYLSQRQNEEINRMDAQFIALSERASSESLLVKLNAISTLPIFAKSSRNNSYMDKSDEKYPYLNESIDIITNILTIESQYNSKKENLNSTESNVIEIISRKAINKINQNTLKIGEKSQLISVINLQNTFLRGISFGDIDLRGANLSKADLGYTNFVGANLDEINLSGACLESSNLFRANLKKSNLNHANLNYIKAIEVDFSDADLSNINCANRADFTCANLINADFTNTIFQKTIFDGAFINNKAFVTLNTYALDLKLQEVTIDELVKCGFKPIKIMDKIFRINQDIPDYWNK